MRRLSVEEIKREVVKNKNLGDFSTDDLVKSADDLGYYLSPRRDRRDALSTNQIRKFLDAVNRLDNLRQKQGFDEMKEQVVLLKPQIAYAAGRKRKEVGPLMEVLDPCLGRIKEEKDFKRLVRFVEAIVAYHKYYGGKD